MPDTNYGHKVFGQPATVALDQIDIGPDRRELDQDHVNELKLSITKSGLICPIALYKDEQSTQYTLLAGLHRLSACKALQLHSIAARVYDHQLSEHELKAIEIYENVHRKNLTDIERDQQIAGLHRMMQSIHGPAVRGSGGHAIKDTARIVGKSVGSVAGALKIDQAIKDFPELGLDKAPNKLTAMRMLQSFAAVIQNQSVINAAATPPALGESYILGDFFENSLPSDTFAIVECDPPYGIDLHGRREAEMTNDYNEVSSESYPDFLDRLCNECYRLASPNSWMLLWHGHQWYQFCIESLTAAGFSVCPVPMIWKKGTRAGQTNSPSTTLGSSYESLLYARKGSATLQLPGRSNIFDYASVPPSSNRHPTERPLPMVQDLLNTFGWPNTRVLSPFLGSGNTILAANALHMQCVGFDLSSNYRNEFIARLLANNNGDSSHETSTD